MPETTAVSVEIDYNVCENTQTCEAVCPVGVFVIEGGRVVVTRPWECTICFKCVESCPSAAVAVDY
jgi:NAD-dependent dihydropyrimidine dehydrogenase PreA subunit